MGELRRLTLSMRGARRRAKPAVERPFDATVGLYAGNGDQGSTILSQMKFNYWSFITARNCFRRSQYVAGLLNFS